MSDNNLYVACIDLHDRDCLVVGAGNVGLEKTQGLLKAGAFVTVVAPEVDSRLRDLAIGGRVQLIERAFFPDDVAGRVLVIAATSDNAVNRRVYGAARERGVLVNVADVPDLCDFILPAIHRNGPLAVAVSTNGASPALAQRMREEAASYFDDAYAELAEILEGLRPWAKATLPTYGARKAFFDGIVHGQPDPIELLRAGNRAGVRDLIERAQRSTRLPA
ncbi:MAG: bifunctional precorrin-2 dehydrogenase/sirohydrochlorin ferrochelatase [Actinomycetota bacterium]